jgi:hypothetical protein
MGRRYGRICGEVISTWAWAGQKLWIGRRRSIYQLQVGKQCDDQGVVGDMSSFEQIG